MESQKFPVVLTFRWILIQLNQLTFGMNLMNFEICGQFEIVTLKKIVFES